MAKRSYQNKQDGPTNSVIYQLAPCVPSNSGGRPEQTLQNSLK